jgi:urea transport system permease protein
MGALFIGVVQGFPNGLAGVYQSYIEPALEKLLKRIGLGPKVKPIASPVQGAHAAE